MVQLDSVLLFNLLLHYTWSQEYLVNINNNDYIIETENYPDTKLDDPEPLDPADDDIDYKRKPINLKSKKVQDNKQDAPQNEAGKLDDSNGREDSIDDSNGPTEIIDDSNGREEIIDEWADAEGNDNPTKNSDNKTKDQDEMKDDSHKYENISVASAAGSIKEIQKKKEDEDTYDYKEENLDDIPENSEGSRLVGAKAASTDKFTFLVAWNDKGQDRSKCTGSLISSEWFLTAAHCTELIPRDGREQINKECLGRTKQGKSFDATNKKTGFVRHLKCRLEEAKANEGADLENLSHLVFYDIEPKPVAWIGVDDVNDMESWNNSGEKRTIAEIVRHAQSYKGGGSYGSYGGHDISLVRLDKPMMGTETACLPGPKFKDEGILAKLAGYGRYHRDGGKTCQTDAHGQYKYHYCEKRGDGSKVCNLNKKSQSKPAPRSKECKKFFDHKDTPKDIPVGKDEIMIVKGNSPVAYGENVEYCYRQFSPSDLDNNHGWCQIRGDFYNPETVDKTAEGWGFCSNDCFLDENEASSGKLRAVHKKHVLSDKLCQQFLNYSLTEFPEVRPKVLCVGMQKDWNTEIWEKSVDGGYMEMDEDITEKILEDGQHFGDHIGLGGYLVSAGTCMGDSGGPLFVEEEKKHIVTGVVSGGRGMMGKCGGINNPVHYVRVKMFINWIIHFVKTKNLCWDKNWTKTLKDGNLKDNY